MKFWFQNPKWWCNDWTDRRHNRWIIYQHREEIWEKNPFVFYCTVDDKNLMFDEMYNSFEILTDIEKRIADEEEEIRRGYYEKGDDLDTSESILLLSDGAYGKKILSNYSKVC
jgi:hypothetical protein